MKRYHMYSYTGCKENQGGEWCKYLDVAALESQLQQAQDTLQGYESLTHTLSEVNKENAALRADNAAMICSFYGRLAADKILAKGPHPGASLLKELEALRASLKAYNGFEPCDFNRLADRVKKMEESAKDFNDLVAVYKTYKKALELALSTIQCNQCPYKNNACCGMDKGLPSCKQSLNDYFLQQAKAELEQAGGN